MESRRGAGTLDQDPVLDTIDEQKSQPGHATNPLFYMDVKQIPHVIKVLINIIMRGYHKPLP